MLLMLLLISTLLVGYLWGKHDGRVEGYQRGTAELPLLLREQSLEQGHCVLCSELRKTHDATMEWVFHPLQHKVLNDEKE